MPSGIPPNASVQLIRLTFMIKILAVVQLALGILSMFVDIFSGLMMMIGSLILYMIVCGRNWCTPVFYIVLTMMDMMTSIMLVGNYFAKNSRIDSGYGVLLFFTMIKFPFYTLSMFYSFLAYRELKALFLGIMYEGVSEFAQAPQPFAASRPSQDPPRQPPPPQAFTGPGYRLN